MVDARLHIELIGSKLKTETYFAGSVRKVRLQLTTGPNFEFNPNYCQDQTLLLTEIWLKKLVNERITLNWRSTQKR